MSAIAEELEEQNKDLRNYNEEFDRFRRYRDLYNDIFARCDTWRKKSESCSPQVDKSTEKQPDKHIANSMEPPPPLTQEDIKKIIQNTFWSEKPPSVTLKKSTKPPSSIIKVAKHVNKDKIQRDISNLERIITNFLNSTSIKTIYNIEEKKYKGEPKDKENGVYTAVCQNMYVQVLYNVQGKKFVPDKADYVINQDSLFKILSDMKEDKNKTVLESLLPKTKTTAATKVKKETIKKISVEDANKFRISRSKLPNHEEAVRRNMAIANYDPLLIDELLKKDKNVEVTEEINVEPKAPVIEEKPFDIETYNKSKKILQEPALRQKMLNDGFTVDQIDEFVKSGTLSKPTGVKKGIQIGGGVPKLLPKEVVKKEEVILPPISPFLQQFLIYFTTTGKYAYNYLKIYDLLFSLKVSSPEKIDKQVENTYKFLGIIYDNRNDIAEYINIAIMQIYNNSINESRRKQFYTFKEIKDLLQTGKVDDNDNKKKISQFMYEALEPETKERFLKLIQKLYNPTLNSKNILEEFVQYNFIKLFQDCVRINENIVQLKGQNQIVQKTKDIDIEIECNVYLKGIVENYTKTDDSLDINKQTLENDITGIVKYFGVKTEREEYDNDNQFGADIINTITMLCNLFYKEKINEDSSILKKKKGESFGNVKKPKPVEVEQPKLDGKYKQKSRSKSKSRSRKISKSRRRKSRSRKIYKSRSKKKSNSKRRKSRSIKVSKSKRRR